MRKSDSLFLLVKSLNSSEKRYFKGFTKGLHPKEKLDYHQLFDVLSSYAEKKERYNEKEILLKLGGGWNPKKLTAAKNYLYHSILRAIRYYHSEKRPRLQLKEWMIDIDLLYEKGLKAEALRYIRKAKKLAGRFDYNLEYLELLLLERRIQRQYRRKNTIKTLQKLQEDSRIKLDHLQNQFHVLGLYESVFMYIRNQGLSLHSLDQLKEQLGQLLEQGTGNLEDFSFEERIYYHLTYSMYYLLTQEGNNRLHHLSQLLNYFEENFHLLDDFQYQERYLSCLNNYINHCYLYQSGEELMEQIEQLEKLSPKGYSMQIQLQQYLYYAKMLYFFKQKKFAAIAELGVDIEELLEQHNTQINLKRRLTFHINLASAYLLEQQYSNAQDQINLIINEPKFEISRDIQMLSRIFQIILFYSQENMDSAEYEVFKAIRYLKLYRNNNRIEKTIINAFKKAIQEGKSSVLLDLYSFLKEEKSYEEIMFWLEKEVL